MKHVRDIITENMWDEIFPIRDEAYNYSYFLYAVAAYPAFCNTSIEPDKTVDYVCRRELATLFTHMIEDTRVE